MKLNKPMRDKPDWNAKSGDWQDLEDDSQAPRYREIAKLVKELLQHNKPTILDIGCGMGVLAKHLSWCDYTGVEPSIDAVAQAQAKFPSLRFHNSTAEDFAPASLSDGVIMSEMLYYSTAPIALIQKFGRQLKTDGIIIITIYIKPGLPSLRQVLRRAIDWRRPVSNAHCSKMVENFLLSNGRILRKSEVQIPGTSRFWRVWAWAP